MKWLEGWLGTASGALGVLTLAIMSVFTPAQVQTASELCISANGGQTTCSANSSAAPGPNMSSLVLLGVVALLFIGVLVGTWLDLRGARGFGRFLLLTSATFLLASISTIGQAFNLSEGQMTGQIYIYILLALVTGVLACIRRDAPRSAATTGV